MELKGILDAYLRYENAFLNSKEAIERYEAAYREKLTLEGNKPSTAPASVSSASEPKADTGASKASAPKSNPTPSSSSGPQKMVMTGHFCADQIDNINEKSGQAPMSFTINGKEYKKMIHFNKKDYPHILDYLLSQKPFTAEYVQNPNNVKEVWFLRMVESGTSSVTEAPAEETPAEPKTETQVPKTINRSIIILDDEFTTLEDSVVANCKVGDKECPVYFDNITPEIDAAKGGKSVEVALYKTKDGVRCYGNAR